MPQNDITDLTITNPHMIEARNVSVSNSVTAVPNVTDITSAVFAAQVPSSSQGAWLHSLSLSFSSNFQSKFSYWLDIDGIITEVPYLPSSYSRWQLPDQSSTSYNYVPTGKRIFVKAGSWIKIYAYNSGSASSAGTFSVTAMLDIIR